MTKRVIAAGKLRGAGPVKYGGHYFMGCGKRVKVVGYTCSNPARVQVEWYDSREGLVKMWVDKGDLASR